MDSYIKDVYGGHRDADERSLGEHDVGQPQSVEPGVRSGIASEQIVPELPANNIQRMNAAHSALNKYRAQRAALTRTGPGQRVKRADARGAILREWNSKCEIQNVSLPQLVSSTSCSERFRVTVTWIDETGRPHRKDVNFGEEGKQEFIDHKDAALRDARLAKMEEETLLNPLHPNFWEFHLLNKYPDINVAYMKFVQDNALTGRRLVLKKEFRQNEVGSYDPAHRESKRYAKPLPAAIANLIPREDEVNMEELDEFRYGKY